MVRPIDPPMGLVAELTHRCPLQCPYCANPVALQRSGSELDTATWRRVLQEAAALGVLQLHFSGGEPTARKDLLELVQTAATLGLYSNLITSGVLLDEPAVDRLARAGLDHVQISLQDAAPDSADRIGGFASSHARKLAAARAVTQAGLALTLNFVVRRQNVTRVFRHARYRRGVGRRTGGDRACAISRLGVAQSRRAAPSRAELDGVTTIVEAARRRLKAGSSSTTWFPTTMHGARRPAWVAGVAASSLSRRPIAGTALPRGCIAAGIDFTSVREQSLDAIWHDAPGFARFRVTDWMPQPCRSSRPARDRAGAAAAARPLH